VLINNNSNKNISFGSLKAQKKISEKMMKIYQQTYPVKFHSNTQVDLLSLKASQKGKQELAERLKDISYKYSSEIHKIRKNYENCYFSSWKSFIDTITQCVTGAKAANCAEQATLLQDIFLKNNEEAHLIKFNIVDKFTGKEGLEHTFLLKGAKEKAKWYNPKTWGNEAVIVDPWSNIILDAKEGIEQFKKMFNFNPEKENMYFYLEDRINVKAYLEKQKQLM